MGSSVTDMIAHARTQVRNLTVAEAAQALEDGRPTLVDLREPGEVEREGHIPGAVLAPRGMLEFWADPSSAYHRAEFDPASPTVLYCASGGRSALAALALQELGYTDVAHLDGGLAAWKQQGRPVTFQQPDGA
ncbi:rhodanese-like domain-containing protein [Actinomadura rubrisoli]|uniref:Rhodanese-like domain-containing protein n=1 Tax=Actinomadura rubrisoli TaxID=2530368 RepID=A0A4R5B5Y3_9ACTN|nr:rhodanese-like domain-containing protein [Actinomadura rubrisoli]TDD81678.1 rhodanese-like domain-containing protein [Actinomadura rubrisoli]